MSKQLICVGVISSAYHLQGLVKISAFTSDPKNICKWPCVKASGEEIICHFVKNDKGKIICRIDGINDRTDAEKIVGTKLYITRDILPDLEESEYYIEDLVGLDVVDVNDEIIGKVIAIHNFGAGDIIEIRFKDKRSEMYSFTKEIFPEINKYNIRFVYDDEESPVENGN
jgi:16S rRNA processing protein RimM